MGNSLGSLKGTMNLENVLGGGKGYNYYMANGEGPL